MKKKILLFLPAVVLMTSVNLMAMEQPVQNDNRDPRLFSKLPEPAKGLIVGQFSDDPNAICNLSLVSKSWANTTHDLRKNMVEAKYADSRPAAQLGLGGLEGYKRAVMRYAYVYKMRKKYSKFEQNEFVALQDVILNFLDSELRKPANQDVRNYLYIPLSLNIGFHEITYSTDGDTPLRIVACDGILPAVQAFIKAGADVNKGAYGEPPLSGAALNGHLLVVQELIKAGADVNKARTNDGVTPLYLAANQGRLPVVQELIKAGADVNKADDDGVTPLYLAANQGHLPVVQELIKAGADVNKARTDYGVTPLIIAVDGGYLRVVQELIKAGADVNKADDDGTPLRAAVDMGYLQIAQELITAGASVNATRTADGSTTLHLAALNGDLEMVKLLLAAGVDLDVKVNDSAPQFDDFDIAGLTALQIAQNKGYREIVDAINFEKEKRAAVQRKKDRTRTLDQVSGDSNNSDEPEQKRQKTT